MLQGWAVPYGFDGSITDSTHYMHLTVAEGQRHNGIAGTGVVVDGQGGVGTHLFNIRDPYTRLEWLEITNIYDNLGQPITTDNPPDADGSLIAHILLHDYSSNIRGINIYSSVTVRNCILYDGDFGIRMYEDFVTVTMDNNTVYNMSGDGFSIRQTATAIMRNNISVGCGGQDFDIESGINVDPSSGNNLYSTVDAGIHPGTNNQSPPASLDDLFISIT
ncbi:MAG: right-handed parallel beta-helix repeat-containing protein, partial [Planctomycetota bacterium]